MSFKLLSTGPKRRLWRSDEAPSGGHRGGQRRENTWVFLPSFPLAHPIREDRRIGMPDLSVGSNPALSEERIFRLVQHRHTPTGTLNTMGARRPNFLIILADGETISWTTASRADPRRSRILRYRLLWQ